MKGKKIRILAIAPYESMKMDMLETVKEFDDIDLNVFVGDLRKGLLLAQHNFYNDYDIIVSRGGTASMLQEQLKRPIIQIEISPLDILSAMKMGENLSGTYTIVGFPNITRNAQVICEIMGAEINVFNINSEDEVEDIVKEISKQGGEGILCDMIAYTTALKFGLTPVLIKSGQGCIRNAFSRARQLYYAHRELREENRFLRSLIWKHINHTVIFDEDGMLFFSTMENNKEPIIDYLRSECGRETDGVDCHIIKQINNVRYSIRLTKEYLAQKEYTVYYFTESKVSLPDIKRGIRYLGKPEAEMEYTDSIYGVAGIQKEFCVKVSMLNQSGQPILIYGENGTCKEQAAKYVYLQSGWNNKPFVLIDCFMVDKKAWDYLMNHYNSPLAQDGCTIYIKNLDILTSVQRKQMLANLLGMNVCRRNRVIFSSVCDRRGAVTETGKDFLETLCCVTLYLPPLREEKERLPITVGKYLNFANVKLQKPLIGIDKKAEELLKSYEWPHNYTQLQRVMEEAVMMSGQGMIQEEDIRTILKRENSMATVDDKIEDADVRLNLHQSLEKINRDIANKILEEEHGNRTNAANRLEISRTTLWRLLKKE